MVSDAHHIFTEKSSFILHLPEEGLESISCMQNPNRPSIMVEDWDVEQAAVPHDRPHIVKPIARTARDNVLRHHRCNCERAGVSLAMGNPTNDVCLCENADRYPGSAANDQQFSLRGARQQFGCMRDWGVVTNCNEALTCDWEQSFDQHRMGLPSLTANASRLL